MNSKTSSSNNWYKDMKMKPINKTVLLFSGGMDSVMAWQLLNPDVLLYIGCHSQYQKKEIKYCDSLASKYKAPIQYNFDINLSKFERSDSIIPLRNLFFISIASYYGDRILIGAMNGDRTVDKSVFFIEDLQRMLRELYVDQHWCEKREIHVEAIYDKKYTKAALLQKYIEEKKDINLVINSLSCYSPEDGHCGECKPCFRKWVAFMCNELDVSFFKKNPKDIPQAKLIYEKSKSGEIYRSRQEDDEVVFAWEK